MIVYIIRHAWAGSFGDPAWPDDFERPLTEEGKARFAQMVGLLSARGFSPDRVATSPLVRCRQTAELVARGVAGSPEVVSLEALMPDSDLRALIDWTRRQSADCREVAWVGHAPDVGYLATTLIGDGHGWIRFAKGAVAAIRFDGDLAPGQGQLRWLATAKLLDC